MRMFLFVNLVFICGIYFIVNLLIFLIVYVVFMINFIINCMVKFFFVNFFVVIGRFMICKVWIDNYIFYV